MALYEWQKTKYDRTWKIEVLGSGTADSLLVDKSPEYRFVSPPTDKSPGVYPRELVIPIIDRPGDRGYLTDRLFDEVLDVELSLDGSLYFSGKSWAEDRRRPLLQDEFETSFVVTDRLSELEDHTYDGTARTFSAFLREILYKTGIELPIHLYTDWQEDNATGDLPDNHRVTIEEVDITYLQALNRFCETFGFQVFQNGGVWVVRQVSYYTGNGVTEWAIASDGTLSSSSVSGKEKSLTAPYKDESFDDALKGVGEARSTFNIPVLQGEIENDAFEAYDGTDFEHWDMTGTVSQVEDDDKFWARITSESANLEQRVERIVRTGDRLNITAEIRTNVSIPENHIDFLRVWFIDSRDGAEYAVTTETNSITRVGSTDTFLYEHLLRVSTTNGIPLGFTGKVRFEYQFEDQGGYFTFYELDYLRCEFRINSAVNNRHVAEATAGPLTNREDVVLPIGENSDQYAEYEIEFNDGSWKPSQSWGGDSHYVKRAKDYLKVRNQNMNIVDYVFDLDEVDDMMAIYSFDGRSYLPFLDKIIIGENDVHALLIEHEETSNTISTDEFFDNGGDDRVIGRPTRGPGGGGEADGFFFEISNNLSEGDPAGMRGNLGLSASDSPTFDGLTSTGNITSDGFIVADLGFIVNSADGSDASIFIREGGVNKYQIFKDDSLDDALRVFDFDTSSSVFVYRNGNFGINENNPSSVLDVGGAMRAETVRTNTGKFLSPTSYQFRNAGDTGFRDVEMADVAADAATLSSTLDVSGLASLDGGIDVDGAFTVADSTGNINTSGTLDVTGKGTFGGEVEVNGVLNVDGNIALDDSATDISTDTFASGFAGSGLAFLQDGTWDGTLDNLTVRQRLRVYELLINQVRATNGSLVVTSATKTGREDDLGFSPVQQLGGTLDWTSTDPFWTESDQFWYRTYRVYIEENQFVPFVEDDLVISQRFTGGGVHLVEGTVINVENGSATVTDNSTRRYFDINLTDDSDIPASGMDFVRWGNLTDPDRQGVLYLTADDDNAPYIDVVYGMDAHSKRNSSGTVKGRIGRLDGITDPDFPDLDGNQTNLFGVYFDGNIYINDGNFRGTVTVTDSANSNVALKGEGGNVIIRSDTEPSTRSDGSALVEGDLWIETDNGDKPWTYNGSDFVETYTVIDGGNLSTRSVTAAKITADAITANEIAADTITANEIDANTITASEIAVDTITASEIAADTITTSELAADSVTATEINVSDLSAVSASIDGTLTMGASGEITNTNDDYSINNDGFFVNTGDSFSNPGSYTVNYDDGTTKTPIGQIGGNVNSLVLKSLNGRGIFIVINDFDASTESLNIEGLRTTQPTGGGGEVWNDGGTLKIET